MNEPLRLLCVVGARPNFMKIAPLLREFESRPEQFSARLVHTGQHYDEAMQASFFRALGIPSPDIDLEVGSASHAVQTAEIMRRFEPVLQESAVDAVLVVGDVNSTIACALVAAKLGVPVIHVEAGLRSYDRGMPEEINRVLTDQLSELLFTTEPDGERNLLREGIDPARIHYVGNVMIDTLLHNLERAPKAATVLRELGENGAPEQFGLLTLHRPSNVDDRGVFQGIVEALAEIAPELPLVFPVHPRTQARLDEFGFGGRLRDAGMIMAPPLSYLDLVALLREAKLVLTDSGGLQEESTALGVPCLTLRENTERPITVELGSNTVVGSRPQAILAAYRSWREGGGKRGKAPPLWDGRAAERIADRLAAWARTGDAEHVDGQQATA